MESGDGPNAPKDEWRKSVNANDVRVEVADGGLDAERTLALQYAARGRRDALAAVWALDARMRKVFAAARESALAQIKLAWWEERLAELPGGAAPAEPLLQRLAPLATGAEAAGELCGLAGAWRELGGAPWPPEEVGAYARLRGGGLIAASARALGARPDARMAAAGEALALVDLAGIVGDAAVRDGLLAEADARFGEAGRFVWPRALRPVGMIVALAREDARNGAIGAPGSPLRVVRMAWHAVSGR